jgi:uncharacterized protein
LIPEIPGDPKLSRLHALVCERMKGDPGHDVHHLVRVARWTLRLGEGKLEARPAVAAALLHDIVNLPKDSPERARASEYSAAEGARILKDLDFSPSEIEEATIAIRQHSFSRGEKPERLLAQCLQDADRLEALGAIGTFRLISTGGLMGAAYFDPVDPWAEKRELDDRAFSVDHFFRKLFKLPDLMNTDAGRREALRRLEIMHGLLEQLGRELDRPYAKG